MTKRDITGILLLDKPLGLSSNQALQNIKRLFNAKKAGHTGSLDPLATGMLPICFGEATKFSQYLLDAEKTYQVKMQLGVRTTTSDAEGEVVATKPVPTLSNTAIETVLQKFRGHIMQVPSMFSALKFEGKPLYKYAREGITIDRPARPIEIYSLQCVQQAEDFLVLNVHCSKGTYVRTLVDDIGELLGCGAHVIELRRLSVSKYSAEQMLTYDALESLTDVERDQQLIGVDTALADIVGLELSDRLATFVAQGQTVFVPHAPADGLVKLHNASRGFLGLGEILPDGRVAPKRLVKNN